MGNIDAVSLFCGAGGLDLGFHQAGINTIWANDFNHDACMTHKAWSKACVVEGDIGLVNFDDIPKTRIIMGGFPCQGFSLAGPRKLDDSRNILYRYFVKLVELKQPEIFVAENVKGLLTLGDGAIKEAIINDFASKGYDVQLHLVNAYDYGCPQDRLRVIIIGIKKGLENIGFIFPEPITSERIVMRDVLEYLPEPKKEQVCLAPFSSRYMSRNRRRDWAEPSFTIPAMAKQVPLHPSSPLMQKIDADHWEFGKGFTRRLSYVEAAAIQTFPYGMDFYGDLTSKYKQIGNAVPVNLAYKIGKAIVDAL